MSYNYLTQWDSPNYTPASQTASTWGVNRQLKEIAVHWWNAPGAGATFEGVVGGFLRPGGLSAHFVATGNGRRAACLVSPSDNSWATGPGNPYTISIECDPAQTDQDYDTIGELIADIRSAYGANLPLVPHSKYVNTRCCGTYDLGRLDAVANSKVSHAEWGQVTDKVTAPQPAKATRDQVVALYREILEREPDADGLAHYTGKYTYEFVRSDLLNSSERSILVNRKAAEAQAALDAAKKAAEEQAKKDAERAERDRASDAATKAAKEAAEIAKQNQSLLNQILDILKNLLAKFTSVFK